MLNKEILTEARIIVAGFLKERRIELGLSQLQVAEAIGVKQSSYTRMEGGKFFLSTKHLFALCAVLKVYIYFEEKESDSDLANMLKFKFTGGIPPSKN